VFDAGMLAEVDSDAQILSASEEYPPFINVRAVECNPAIAGIYRMLQVVSTGSENDKPLYEKIDGLNYYHLSNERPARCSLGPDICVDNNHHWVIHQRSTLMYYPMIPTIIG
jgi:hypothetical protein